MKTVFIGLILMAGMTPFANAQATVDVGRTGEITIDHQTNVGRRILRPGHYRVQHIVKQDGHVMRFSPVGEIELLYRPIEVACEVESTGSTVEETVPRLREGAYRAELLEVRIKGETVVHVF